MRRERENRDANETAPMPDGIATGSQSRERGGKTSEKNACSARSGRGSRCTPAPRLSFVEPITRGAALGNRERKRTGSSGRAHLARRDCTGLPRRGR